MSNTQPISAKIKTIGELLKEEKTLFYIPIYQRNYDWDKDKEVRQLLDDFNKFLSVERDKGKRTNKSYYLGNIVIKPSSEQILGQKPKSSLIDGQQRITTLLLIVICLNAKLNEYISSSELTYTERKNLEKMIFFDGNITEDTLKAFNKKHESDLWDIFQSSRRSDFSVSDDNAYIDNYRYIENFMSEQVNTLGNLKEFLTRWNWLLDSVKLVSVTLDEDDSEIDVFESINSKGLPLSLFDLVRNFFFLWAEHLGESERTKNNIEEKFETKIRNNFSKKSRGSLLLDNTRFNGFISSILLVEEKKHFSASNIMKLYGEFKKYFGYKMDKNGFDAVFTNFMWYVDVYNQYKIEGHNFHTKVIENNSKTWDYKCSIGFLSFSKIQMYLPLFFRIEWDLKTRKIDSDEKVNIFKLLDMHNVMAEFSGSKNKDNRFVVLMIQDKKLSENFSHETLMNFLVEKSISNKSGLISKSKFINGLRKYKIYKENPTVAKYVLFRITNQMQQDDRSQHYKEWTLEHIMSQTLIDREKWKNLLNVDESNFNLAQDKYLHTLSNLTLLKLKSNSTISNKSNDKKLNEYAKTSSYITREIQKYVEISDDKNFFERRQSNLEDEILKIWEIDSLPSEDLSFDGMYALDSYFITSNPLTIKEVLQIVLYEVHPQSKKTSELVSLVKEYCVGKVKGIDISFNPNSIASNALWERLHRNSENLRLENERGVGKSKRFEESLFRRQQDSTWNLLNYEKY